MLSRLSKSVVSPFKYNKSFYVPSYSFAIAGDLKTVAGHKPPLAEDSPHGRYASVLFTVASKKECLDTVLDDIQNLKELYKNSDAFRNFVYNTAFKRTEQTVVFNDLYQTANLTSVTQEFLNTLIDNKRVDILPKVIDKYIDYCRILNKEENIRIISAEELSETDKQRVHDALKKSNAGVNFTLRFEIDPTIMGGLQMYSGNRFMDASLASRVARVKAELAKITF